MDVAVTWTAEWMWLQMEQELHFGTNQRATDGNDISSFGGKRGKEIICLTRERERERYDNRVGRLKFFTVNIDDYYLVHRLKIFKVTDTITVFFVTLIFHDGKQESYIVRRLKFSRR